MKMYRTFVLYGCETLSLTLRVGHRLRVFENRVLRKIFGPERDEVAGEWKNYIMGSLMMCTPRQIFGWSNEERDRLGMWHVWERREVYTEFWWETSSK